MDSHIRELGKQMRFMLLSIFGFVFFIILMCFLITPLEDYYCYKFPEARSCKLQLYKENDVNLNIKGLKNVEGL